MMKLTINNRTDFTLKFGKYKGLLFSNTPQWYQDWLLAQDWFIVPPDSFVVSPAPFDAMQTAQKDFSNSIKNKTLTTCIIN